MIAPPVRERFSMPTLFSVYEPIESYLEAVETARGGQADGDRAALSPGALDFFLLERWIAQYALRPRVIDLASQETLGASTLFFLGNPQVREVQVLPPVESTGGDPDWRPLLEAAVSDCQPSPQPACRVLAASRVGEIGRCFRGDELRPPLLVLWHADEKESPESLENTWQELLSLQEDVVVAVYPLGRIGRCGVLASLIAHCASHPEHRLAAFREICPFTAKSQMGIMYRSSNSNADEMFERLGHGFDGNFQFLSLTRELAGSHLTLESLNAKLAHFDQTSESLNAKLAHFDELHRSESWRAFCKFQEVRQRFLPPGSRRDRLARAIWRAARRAKRALRSVTSRFRKAA